MNVRDIQEFQIKKDLKQAPNVRITIEAEGQIPIVLSDVKDYVIMARRGDTVIGRNKCTTSFLMFVVEKINEQIEKSLEQTVKSLLGKFFQGKTPYERE